MLPLREIQRRMEIRRLRDAIGTRSADEVVIPRILPFLHLEDVIAVQDVEQGPEHPSPLLFVGNLERNFSQLFRPHNLAIANIHVSCSDFMIIGHNFLSNWLIMMELLNGRNIVLHNVNSNAQIDLPELPNFLEGSLFSELEGEPNDGVILILDVLPNGINVYRRFGNAPVWLVNNLTELPYELPTGFLNTPHGLLWFDRSNGMLSMLRDWEHVDGQLVVLQAELAGHFNDASLIVPARGVGALGDHLYFFVFDWVRWIPHRVLFEEGEVVIAQLQDLEGLSFYLSRSGNGFAIEPEPEHAAARRNRLFCSSWGTHDCAIFNWEEEDYMNFQILRNCYALGEEDPDCLCDTRWFLSM